MKRHLIFCLAGLMFSLQALAQFTYVQVTAGLTDVYESGRTEFALGDIDNDGDLDIVSVGDHWSPLIATEYGIMVFKNNGNGTSWSKVMNGDFGYGGVALGDVNNDGLLDVAYGIHHNYAGVDFGDQVLEVVLGDGTGNNWVPWDDNLGLQGQSWGMAGCDMADVDNDGKLDLGSNSFGCCDGVWLYKNNGNGTWTPFPGALDLNSSGQFRFGDFDKDGKADFMASNTQFNNQPGQVWRNNGNGQFTPMQTGLPFNTYSLMFDLADMNNDGAMDIATTQGGYPRVFTYDIPSNSWVNSSNGLPASSQSLQHLAFGDLDADGSLDLITYRSGLFTIYRGDGTGNWLQSATLTVPETTLYDVKLRDLDHNGYPDIIYWAKYNGSNMLRVYLNTTIATEMSISPLFPKGNEFFCHGSMQFIKWTSSLPPGDSATVSIDFSSTGPQGPFTPVIINIPNSGMCQWTIPGTSSVDCYLKFTLTSSSNTYSVVSGPFGIDTCGATPVIPGPVSGYTTVCEGSAPVYSVPPAAGATSYTWTLPPGWTGSSTNHTINTIAGPNSGYISVVANSPAGNSPPQSLYVTVISIDTGVSLNGITLTANLAGAAYQWWDCNAASPVQGASGQTFTPSVNGSYAVIITSEGCTDTSSCHQVIVTGLAGTKTGESILIIPNPAGNDVTIRTDLPVTEAELSTLTGKMIFKQQAGQHSFSLDLSKLPAGMFLLRLYTGEQVFTRKLMKTE